MIAAEHKRVHLTTVDADTPVVDIVNVLKRDGGVIVRNMYPLDGLDKLKAEVYADIEARGPDTDGFFSPEAKRGYCLVNCPSYADVVLSNEIMWETAKSLITSRFKYWAGPKREAVSPPQLSTACAIMLGPGSQAQDFHRDDMCWHQDYKAVDVYPDGRDVEVSVLIAASRATFENGATRIIPGSHLWSNDREPKMSDGVAYAEMEAGSGLIFLGSVYHAGGHNQTKDEIRELLGASFIRSYLRQEENQYLAVKREVAKGLPYHLQDRIGYKLSAPYCGFVNLDSPASVLRDGKRKKSDLFESDI